MVVYVDLCRFTAYNLSKVFSRFIGVTYMEYITVKKAAEKWGLYECRLQTMCNEGLILGVIKFGHASAILCDAEKLIDKRIKSGKYVKTTL